MATSGRSKEFESLQNWFKQRKLKVDAILDKDSRGVVALDSFSKGSLLFEADVWRKMPFLKAKRCWRNCCSKASKKVCSKCKMARYCSRSCQGEDWKALHKTECAFFSTTDVDFDTVPTSVLLLIRFLLNTGDPCTPSCNFKLCKELFHDSSATSEAKRRATATDILAVCGALKLASDSEKREALLMGQILALNTFSIVDEQLRPMGIALFPAASFLNHSCSPNAQRINAGSKLQIRALRDISAGDEVTISYVPCAPRVVRRRMLKEDFGFDCRCPLCTVKEKEMAGLCAVHCAACDAAIEVSLEEEIFPKCPRCGHVDSPDRLSSLLECTQRCEEATKGIKRLPVPPKDLCSEQRSACQSVLAILDESGIVSTSYWHQQALEELLSVELSEKDFVRASAVAERLSTCPSDQLTVAMRKAMHGKLMAISPGGDLKEAAQLIEEAVFCLERMHSPNSRQLKEYGKKIMVDAELRARQRTDQ